MNFHQQINKKKIKNGMKCDNSYLKISINKKKIEKDI